MSPTTEPPGRIPEGAHAGFSRILILATTALLMSGCAYGTQQASGLVLVPVEPDEYPYAAIDPNSIERDIVVNALVERGYSVLTPDAQAVLSDLALPQRRVLWVGCTYRGHVAADAMGSTAAEVTCQAEDLATGQDVYLGRGRHVAMTVSGDIKNATRDALRDFPRRSGPGRSLASTEAARELERHGVGRGNPPAAAANRGGLRLAGGGSGFIVDSAGHVLTNAHVVHQCAEIRATSVPNTVLVVIRLDRQNDLALLGGASGTAFASFRTGRSIRVGESVVAVGFPLQPLLASEANVTTGTVSALTGPGNDSRLIQMTAPVQVGSSGGPLLDVAGNVVGVVVSKLDALTVSRVTGDIPQNINFALAGAVARTFLDATGIDYQLRSSASSRATADVAEEAKRYTLHIQCWQ